MDGQYWKDDQTMSTNECLLTSDFWQFLEPWHGRWYEYEIFIASCTDNIYDLENERWLLGDMIDHVGIYGSKVAEGLSAFNAGLVYFWHHRIKIKLCSYVIRSTRSPSGSQRLYHVTTQFYYLMPSSNKPLLEPSLTKFYDARPQLVNTIDADDLVSCIIKSSASMAIWMG